MVKKQSIFLTLEQARDAICRDFRQYDPQILLFCEIARLLFNGDVVVRKDTQKNGVWVSRANDENMRWMDGAQLADYLCESIALMDLKPDLLAAMCARVFQTRILVAVDPETGGEGLRIETGMEDYTCRQCGRCCTSLDYHDAVTAQDVEKWQVLGRTDILERVGIYQRPGGKTTYRIWMVPGKNQLARTCPFLTKRPSENRWICSIHDIKPAICRDYPVSRKHAILTGCPGFNKSEN